MKLTLHARLFLLLLPLSVVLPPAPALACGGDTCAADVLSGLRSARRATAAMFLKDRDDLTTPVSDASAVTGLPAVNAAYNSMRSANSFTGRANSIALAGSDRVVGQLAEMFTRGLGGFDTAGGLGAAARIVNPVGLRSPPAGAGTNDYACRIPGREDPARSVKLLASPIAALRASPIAGGAGQDPCAGIAKVSCKSEQWRDRERPQQDGFDKAQSEPVRCQPDGRC